MTPVITKGELQDLFHAFARACNADIIILKEGRLNVGAWKLDYVQGVSIMRIADEVGNLVHVFSCGPLPKAELFDRMVFALEAMKIANPTTVKKRN